MYAVKYSYSLVITSARKKLLTFPNLCKKKNYFMGCTKDKEVKWLRFFRLWIVFKSKAMQVPYFLKRKTISTYRGSLPNATFGSGKNSH